MTAPSGRFPRGRSLIDHPLYNRGTAFTEAQRAEWGLHGLLPPHIETLREQTERALGAYREKQTDIERHIYLRALQDRNETLFYRLIVRAAALALSETSPAIGRDDAPLLPPLDEIRTVSKRIALAVAQVAQRQGVAGRTPPDRVMEQIEETFWEPVYSLA